MKTIRLAFLGLGNVTLALLRHMDEPKVKEKLRDLGLEFIITGVATERRGNTIRSQGISPKELITLGKTGHLSLLTDCHAKNTSSFVSFAPGDIFIEATSATADGEPAASRIRELLERGKSVITSNKSPIAWRGRELSDLALKKGVSLRYGATVLAGFPPWKHLFDSITKQEITEMQISVNATSNQILTLMLAEGNTGGKSFDEGVKLAQEMGIAELNPSDDTDGYDTQKKLVILANSLMDANLTPNDVKTDGISAITPDDLKKADESGKWMHLLGHAWKDGGKVRAEVKPIATDNPFFVSMRGTSMGLYFHTPAGNFGIRLDLGQKEKAIMATAAGMFEDIVTVAKAL
jgi:homoserine dehydrogenase